MEFDNSHVKTEVRKSIKKFKEKDRDDLMRRNIYEPTISHRIAVYLEGKFEGYVVDCEYNKSIDTHKKDSKGKNIRPDIIIHVRGTEKNLCVIEVKKASKDSKRGKEDIEKLKDIVENLEYNIGVFVGVLKTKIDICWIEKRDGKVEVICKEL